MQLYLNNNCFEAVIFDLDGTLYPRKIYVSAYYDFTVRALSDLLSYNEEEAENILKSNSISRDWRDRQGSVSSLMIHLGVPLRTWNDYRDKRFDLASIIPYNEELKITIHELADLYKLIIITNNTIRMTRKIMKKLGFDGINFPLVITSDSDIPLKPFSESFTYAAIHFDIKYKGIISIGDRYEVDIEPLLKLGGSGVLVANPNDIVAFSREFLLKKDENCSSDNLGENSNT